MAKLVTAPLETCNYVTQCGKKKKKKKNILGPERGARKPSALLYARSSLWTISHDNNKQSTLPIAWLGQWVKLVTNQTTDCKAFNEAPHQQDMARKAEPGKLS